MPMFWWVILVVFLFSVSPAWADIAIAPVSLYLSGWVLLWPLLIGVILLESLLLWQFWGKKAEYGPLKVLGQVAIINVLSTLAGGLFLILGDFWSLHEAFLPLLIYFFLTLGLETALLAQYYTPAKTAQKLGKTAVWSASFTLNLSSYFVIILALVVIPKSEWKSERASSRYSIRANMHSLQSLIETYGVDWAGEYPADLYALEKEAKLPANPYWLELRDPHSKSPLLYPGEPPRPFAIEYLPMVDAKTGKRLSYWIYGYDKNGQKLLDRSRVFALSNS